MRNLLLLILVIVSFACKKEEIYKDTTFNSFEIKNHYTLNRIDRDIDNSIEGEFVLTESCEYELTNNIGQVNKLIGIQINNNHHENSLRLGWEYMPEQEFYNIWAYYYIDGERGEQYNIVTVKSGEVNTFKVEVSSNKYLLEVNGKVWTKEDLDLNIDKTKLLFPYFGGKEPFPGSLHGDNKCKILIKIK